jgi:HrpA-like RNA helicase
VADDVLSIAAGLSLQSVFVSPFDKRQQARQARDDFAAAHSTQDSDHLTLLAAYGEWLRQPISARWRWCQQRFLSDQTLRQMVDVKRQFAQLLSAIGLVEASACDAQLVYLVSRAKSALFCCRFGIVRHSSVCCTQAKISLSRPRTACCRPPDPRPATALSEP